MKILVTGSAGYIGSLLASVLLNRGYRVSIRHRAGSQTGWNGGDVSERHDTGGW